MTPVDRLHTLTLGDVLAEHARSHPGRVALACGETRLRWPELDSRVDRLANVLVDLGAGAGDVVLWLGQNCHRVLETILACARIGASACPANWRQSADELAFVIDDLAPTVVLWQHQEIGATVLAAREAAAGGAVWIQHDTGGADGYESRLAAVTVRDLPQVDPDLPALVIYTAAFDGRPNGAQISQTGVLMQDMVVALAEQISHETVFLNSGPHFHVGTLMRTMATFHMGGTNVMVRRVDPQLICEMIDSESCTKAFLVRETIERIVELNSGGRWNLKSLVHEPHSPEFDAMVTVTDRVRRAGAAYGQTEVMGLATWEAFGGPAQGRSGRSSPLHMVRIVGDDGDELPPGEVGEIALRGPTVMWGYRNRPELNAERTSRGWHLSNDLGRREPDGSITFVGPKARLIKSGVENIYPAEVESCIRTHPGVQDCAVIGVPDERWVQAVKAIVQLKPGAEADSNAIVEHCRSRIASYKKPHHVVFVDDIPKRSGVNDYAALDATFGGGGYPGGRTPSR